MTRSFSSTLLALLLGLVLDVPPLAAAPASQPSSAPASGPKVSEDLGGEEEDWPEVEAASPGALAARARPRLLDWRAFTRLVATTDLGHEGDEGGLREDVATFTWTAAAEASVAARAGFHFRAGARLRLHLSWRGEGDDALHRSDIELLPADSYLAWQRGSFEVRFGMQTLVWGESDLVNPLDVLAPRDLRLGLLTEPEATRLPSLALSLRARLLALNWSFVWAPIFSPHRVDLFGGDFALLSGGAPAALRPLGGALERLMHDSVEGALQEGLIQTELPRPVVGSDIGLRVARSLRGVDLALQYVYTHQRLPALALRQDLLPSLAPLLTLAPEQIDATTLSPILAALLDAEGGIEQRYPRQHVLGASISRALGRFVASADLAYRSRQLEVLDSGGLLGLPLVDGGRGWLRTTVDTSALAYTLGLRHTQGEELLFVLEWWHELLLDELAKKSADRLPLLMGGPQRGGLAALMRFKRGDLTGQLLMHSEVFFGSLIVTPEVSYRFGEHLLLGVGVNLFVGRRGMGALYQTNDQVYVFVRGDL